MKVHRWLLLGAGWGLIASGCGIEKHNPWRKGDSSYESVDYNWNLIQPSPRDVQPQVDQARDCSAVDSYVKQRMSLEMETSLREQLKWMLEDGAASGSVVPVVGGPDVAVPQASKQEGDAAPGSFTDTNNQVVGVEEPDALKTDGTHFYHLVGRKLRVSKAWPVTEMQALSTLDLPGYPQQMLLTEDKKLVIFLLQLSDVPPTDVDSSDVVALSAKAEPGFLPTYSNKIDILTVDVSAPATPRVLTKRTLRGNLTGARRVGDQVRLVMSRNLPYPTGVETYVSGDIRSKSKQERLDMVEELIRRNKMIIHNQPVASLISSTTPGFELSSGDCQQMFLPRVSTSLGVTDVHTLNLTTGEDHVSSLLSRSDGIHGSLDAIYISTQHYWWARDSFDTNYLYIHKFSYNEAGVPEFRGTAGMEGNLLNQFSMDEYEDHLRVAATVIQRPDPQSFEQVTYNRVYVVKDYDGFLAVAGMTEPLARGETIFGVRFAGPLGYVVTFRRIDPLFVIGFQEPIKPVVLGELKIPGYSTYLHPVGDGLLLAVGEEIDESSQRNLGNKISLFDVTNPAEPKERFKKLLPPDLYTESVYNHKSFKYHTASRTLALPSYGTLACPLSAICEYSYGISLYRIDPDAGILDRGFLNMAARINTHPSNGDDDFGGDDVVSNGGPTHAVIADDVVYGIDAGGVKGALLDAPSGQSWELPYR